jgi:cell division protein FtsZ
MVDEKLDDPVWVTVVATGYGNGAWRPERRLEEPAGEPRVSRARDTRPAAGDSGEGNGRDPGGRAAPRRRTLGVEELDVPEFIPRR